MCGSGSPGADREQPILAARGVGTSRALGPKLGADQRLRVHSSFAIFEEARRRTFCAIDSVGEPRPPLAFARALRTGQCRLDDREFDSLLPRRWRAASWRYWTPLAAVARAATWLDELGVRSVVDIGAGTGKFCVAGALLGRAHFIGVEQRAELVATARVLSRAYGVAERVSFLHETFGEVAPPLADAYYFFNPFGENLFSCVFRKHLNSCSETT